MSILYRYIIKEILKHFGFVLAAAVGIYVSVDFFENIDKFMDAGLPVSRMIEFLQLKLPLIVAQITPVGILLAVLITFGLMSKNNEIIALKSSGLSVYHFLRPILSLGIFFTVLLFYLSEIAVPITISKANQIYRREVKKYAAAAVQKNIWLKGHRSISHISFFNPKDQTISGVTLNFFNQNFKLTRRVDAAKGQFSKGHWVLYDLMEQLLDEKTGSYDVQFHGQRIEKIDFLPEDLQRVAKRSEEMSFKDLYNYIRDVEAEGYDATPYQVDFHAKFAIPVACLIVSVIGTGITLRKETRRGLSVSITYGIIVIFLYWISQSFCLSLGYGGLLPPVVAAWTSNFIFAGFAVYNLINAE
jgi:lipopolysaccharide export system permease protein